MTSHKRFITPSRLALAALGTALLPLSTWAHMTWILPNSTLLTGRDTTVAVEGSVSTDLFIPERSLAVDTVRVTGPDGKMLKAENITATRTEGLFDVALPAKGTYRISNITDLVMARYEVNGKAEFFRGSLADLKAKLPAGAKVLGVTQMFNRQQTFVSREDADTPHFKPEGDGLELLPLSPVNDLSNGDTTRFQVLLDGHPLANAAVSVLREGNRYRYKMGEITLKTDGQGLLSVTWAEPGRYWLGVTPAKPEGADGAPQGGPQGGPPPGAGEGKPAGTPGAPGAGGPGGPGGFGGSMGGTLDKPMVRQNLSATFEVLPR